LLGAGDLDGAIAQFNSAIAASPQYAPAHYQLGVALDRKGLKEAAEKEYRKAAELDAHLGVPSH
jgi:Flp pilus assembly protein TadD